MDGKVLRAYAAWTLLIAPAVAAVLGVAACGSDRVVGPPLPSDAQLFSPPGVYSTWWNMTQACSGLTGSLQAVTWYKTDQVVHDVNSGGPWLLVGCRQPNRVDDGLADRWQHGKTSRRLELRLESSNHVSRCEVG